MEPDQLQKIERAIKEHEEVLGRLKNILKEMKSSDHTGGKSEFGSVRGVDDSPAWSRIFGGY